MIRRILSLGAHVSLSWSLVFSLGIFLWSCDSNETRKEGLRGQSGGADITQSGAREFKLSWAPPKGKVTRFHIFYNQGVSSNKGGNEIDSFAVTPELLKAPQVLLNETNIDPFPTERGSKLCFYVAQSNGNLRSDPSQPVCGILE